MFISRQYQTQSKIYNNAIINTKDHKNNPISLSRIPVPKPRFVNLGVSNVNGCRFLSTSRISTASKGMPFCITRGHPVKSFHAQYVRRSFPDQTK